MNTYTFGDIVVIDDEIGVVVKSWADGSHDVYVRSYNRINSYHESEMKRYIYSKTLSEEEKEFYT